MAKRQVANPSPAPKRLIGYARVSTDDQVHDAQMDELRAAGCEQIFQEQGSGASRARPVLTRLLGTSPPATCWLSSGWIALPGLSATFCK